MTQDEIDEWVNSIGETVDILEDAFATMTAIASLPDLPPVLPDRHDIPYNGTVPYQPINMQGSFQTLPQFSLGAAQVSISDPLVGVVRAAVIRKNYFAVSYTEDNLSLVSHGVSIDMSGAGYVQVCFAYSPVKSDFSVVRWDSSGYTGDLPGKWSNVDTYRQGPSLCSKVPRGVFALAGL
jgi:hypothetical protein